jgi:hypothetical protein
MDNKALIKTVRGVTAKDTGFSKAQAVFVTTALAGGTLTEAQKGHAVRCAKRLLGNASKKETIAKLEKVLSVVEAVDTRGRYEHASAE